MVVRQNELAAHPQFELLSWTFSVDVEWPGWVDGLTASRLSEIKWIEFSESIGLTCQVPTSRSHFGITTAKVSGVVLLIGLGGWLCYKLLKFCQITLQQNGTSSTDPQRKFPHSTLFKTCYFGPANTSDEVKLHKSGDYKTGSNCSLPNSTPPVHSAQFSPASSLDNSKKYCSEPLMYLHSETSTDSISEISFEMDSTNLTVAKLDKLQDEIDQIKDSCLSIDEEFITIKGSRNLPGLSDLIETGKSDPGDQASEVIQSAKTCFKGLYSLTTINQSMSFDLITPTTENKILNSVDEETLPSLEWDELDDTVSNRTASKNGNCTFSSDASDFTSLLSSQISSENWNSETDENYNEYLSGRNDISFMERSPSIESSSGIGGELSTASDSDILNIGPKVDIIEYARSEWKGISNKAETIRKAYSEVAESLGLSQLRVIRGDNYCAIRAVLFQILSQGLPVPSGEQAYRMLCQAPAKSLLQLWHFPRLPQIRNINEGVYLCLHALDRLAMTIATAQNKAETLENILNSEPLLDLQAVEAVKLLMLERTIFLHEAMHSSGSEDVPFFSVLLFARDTSVTPCDFMNNHLLKVGDTGGLEMVEMFLLGYTLNVTLRVVRPSSFGTQDFISYYPDDAADTSPQITLVAEDDRHYNVLVGNN